MREDDEEGDGDFLVFWIFFRYGVGFDYGGYYECLLLCLF